MIGKQTCGKDVLEDFQRQKVVNVFNHHFFIGGEKSFPELIREIDIKKKFEPVIISPEKGKIKKKWKIFTIHH